MNERLIRYVGMSRAGRGQVGQTADSPATLAEKLWSRGYLRLRIIDLETGQELGGIAINEGKRVWWAEA